MKKYLISLFFSVILLNSNAQNIIKNNSFKNGNLQGISSLSKAEAFDNRIDNWEGRYWDSGNVAWHSPDWYPTDEYISIRSYEIVQQKLDTDIVKKKRYKLRFRMLKSCFSEVKLEFYVADSKMKYKKEKLLLFQKEKNHLCSSDYRTLRGNEGVDYYKIAELSDIQVTYPSTTDWYDIELEFQMPDVNGINWFGFQVLEVYPVAFPCSYLNECSIGKIKIDDMELIELDQCSSDPCSPTDGTIDLSYYTNSDYGYCLTGLENVYKVSDFVVRDVLNREIYHMNDVVCENGINGEICWPGINDIGSPVAPAEYIISFNAYNDCGIKKNQHKFVVPQLVDYTNKPLPTCNNQISIPRNCCKELSEYTISDVSLTHPAGLDLVIPGFLTVENVNVDEQSGLVYLQAGNGIELSNCSIEGDFFAEIDLCEVAYKGAIIDYNLNINNELRDNETICDSASAITENAINNFNQNRLIIYPNPAKNELNIYTSGITSKIPFEIVSAEHSSILMKGLVVQNEQVIDISKLPTGCYIIRFYLTERVLTTKIVKK